MRKFLFAFALLTCPLSLFSQNAQLACEGRRATVRISEITPNGTVKGFHGCGSRAQGVGVFPRFDQG